MSALLTLMACVMALSVTSCGDENDENEPGLPATKYSEIAVNYSLELASGYFELWDVEVTYTDKDGEIVTENITGNWEKTYRYSDEKEVPGEYTFNAVAKPKNPVATPEPDKIYILDKSHKFVAIGITGSGQAVLGGDLSSISSKLSTKGEKLQEHVKKDMKITEGSYKVIIR